MEVQVPNNLLTQKINKNDDLKVDIVFDDNPDDVFFSLILFYQLDVVATKSFAFTTFAFRIWDLFNDFQPEKNDLLVRVSLYNPRFFMPSQSSYTITVNTEPVPGELIIISMNDNGSGDGGSSGVSLSTPFRIVASNFYDEDKPLSYRFHYYLSVNHNLY